MLKIREYFLSPVAQKRANKIVEEFKEKVEAICLVPFNNFEYKPYHPIIPNYQIRVFNTTAMNNDSIFNAIMCRNPDNVTIFINAYGRDLFSEVALISFNGDFAKIDHVLDNRLLLSYAKGVEPDKYINLVPFEDKSKGWKQRIANGDTMWPIRGLSVRFQARAECLFKDGGSTEPMSYWREEIKKLSDLNAEKALRDAKKALEDAKREVEEAKRRCRSAEEELERAKKYWRFDDPDAVHTASSILYDYIEEECIEDYGGYVDETRIIEHFDSEDHIAIDVYAYGIRNKDRYIFTKDGGSLVKIEKNA